MQPRANIVIIGAGIVGCSAAQALAGRGWRDVVVLEQGPLWETGGSTSHAPGLVFQTNVSQTMCRLAQASVGVYKRLAVDGQPCFSGVGSLEVAATPERWHDLRRRHGYARSWGLHCELLDPSTAADLLPLLDPRQILGAFYVPSDGIAKAVRAAEALGKEAQAQGVAFYGGVEVTGIEVRDGRVRAVVTAAGRIETERVLVCAGIWGPRIGRMAGVALPLTPVQHQYVRTTPLAALAGETVEIRHPILRHQDKRMYFRQHSAGYGIGSYAHEPLLTSADAIRRHGEGSGMPSIVPFTPQDFAGRWSDARELLPALGETDIASAINGLFSFTPDGMPLVGESAAVRGFWAAEAVWVTQGAGVGAQVAEWLTGGVPSIDLRECNLNRFDAHAAAPSYIQLRGAQQYREVYDIIHPAQQVEQPRPLRTGPFWLRQVELGAEFWEACGWERPQWYAANDALVQRYAAQLTRFGYRDAWAARHWSPIIAAEHLATREHVGMFDMTPLARCEISGPGALALLQSLATNNLDRPTGSLTYTALADERGGILSDLTVTRLGDDRFWVAHNGPNDLAYLQLQRNAGDGQYVEIRDVTNGTCCVGVWGPRARELLRSLCHDELENDMFPYLTARRIMVAEVPVLALRVSFVGELGWELYADSAYGLRLWDRLWQAGQPLGVVAAGRGAFDSLRLEKGYRSYGSDMHSGYDPYEAGIGFTVKLNKGQFRGQAALRERKAAGAHRRLCCLVLDDPAAVVFGREPVLLDGEVVGYVTSACSGYSVGHSIAYSYLPAANAHEGERIEVEYFGRRYGATVSAEPLWDPEGKRVRS